MAQSNHPKRKYHSNRRRQQAEDTRRRILEAALITFKQYGYAGATMEAIARAADVAPLTIFATFGNKVALLSELVRLMVGGDDQSIPLLQRPGPQAVLNETDPIIKLQLFARDITPILDRMAPIFEIMRPAAKTESEVAAILNKMLAERFENLGAVSRSLAANGDLRPGLADERGTEIIWTIASPEVYRLLVTDRGWSQEEFAQWLGDALIRLLLSGS